MVNQFKGSKTAPPQFTRGYGLVFGSSERKAMAMALVDRAMRAEELGEDVTAPAQNVEFVLYHCDNIEATGFVEHLKLPHYVDFQSELESVRRMRAEATTDGWRRQRNDQRLQLRLSGRADQADDPPRAAEGRGDPGHQVPFGSREMPLPYGWGTGGIQVTAAVLGAGRRAEGDRPGRRRHHQRRLDPPLLRRTAGVRTTTRTGEATVIQTRHRIPESRCAKTRSSSIRCRSRSRCRGWNRAGLETRSMHALAEYGLMHVKLYEDIARFGQVSISYDYPVMVNHRYLMSPSPIPAFDNPKMHMMPALQLFGAGREKRIYAVPPYTEVRTLDFDDHPFRTTRAPHRCGLCGAADSYLDEVVTDDRGGRMFVCSDTDHCAERRAAATSAPKAVKEAAE